MNFQECLNQPDTHITFKATVVQMDERRASQKTGKWSRQIRIADSNNMEQRVKIYEGSGPGIDPSELNQVLTFKIRAYSNQHGTFFDGFWESREDANTYDPQAAPQTTQQAVQSAPQPAQAPKSTLPAPNSFQDHAPPGYDGTIQKEKHLPAPQAPGDKDASICRQVAGKVAGRCVAAILQVKALQTGTTIEDEIMEIAEPLANWFLTGLRSAPDVSDIPNPDPRIQEEPPKEDEDNIPF